MICSWAVVSVCPRDGLKMYRDSRKGFDGDGAFDGGRFDGVDAIDIWFSS